MIAPDRNWRFSPTTLGAMAFNVLPPMLRFMGLTR